jgi:hypothetical protein
VWVVSSQGAAGKVSLEDGAPAYQGPSLRKARKPFSAIQKLPSAPEIFLHKSPLQMGFSLSPPTLLGSGEL